MLNCLNLQKQTQKYFQMEVHSQCTGPESAFEIYTFDRLSDFMLNLIDMYIIHV
mgnify:CR=1 FL=1